VTVRTRNAPTQMMRSLLLLLLAATLTEACQGAMSVEEARKVSTSFAGTAFIPPPRTIKDITAILHRQPIADRSAFAADEVRLKAVPPDVTDPRILSDFFYRRGALAVSRGRPRQAQRDLSRALENARRASAPEYRILSYLAFAEGSSGVIVRSREYYRAAIKSVPYDDRGWLFGLYHYLAFAAARGGDFKEAEASVQQLDLLLYESRGWRGVSAATYQYRQALAKNSRAVLHEFRGEFAKAEELYRAALADLASDPANSKIYLFDLVRARLGRSIAGKGRLLEAESEIRSGLLGSLSRNGRYSSDVAILLDFLTVVIFAQGRYADAEALARTTVEINEALGFEPDSLSLAFSRDWLATAIEAQGRHADAVAEFEKLRPALANEPEMLQSHFEGYGFLRWPLALLKVGRYDDAITMLTSSLIWSQRVRGDDHPRTAEIRGTLAMAHQHKGDLERALAEFQQSVSLLLGQAGAQDAEADTARQGSPSGLRQEILTGYLALLVDIRGTGLESKLGRDPMAEAFRLADVARGQVVQAALSAAAARAGAKDPRLADLIRREQDARNQVAALYGAVANAASVAAGKQDAAVITSIRQDAGTLQRARRALLDKIKQDFPDYGQLISPTPATITEIRGALRPGGALVNTYVAPDRTYVWAVPASGPVSFAIVPIGEARLASIVAGLRASLDVSATTLADIPAFDVVAAHDLYRQLLEPVKPGWAAAKSLVVVPHGPLTQLPFALLVTSPVPVGPDVAPLFANYRSVPWLIRSHALTVLPSVTSLRTLRALPPADATRLAFVGFGDPYFNADQALRAVRSESSAPPAGAVVGLAARSRSITLRDLKISKADSVKLALLPRLPDTAEEIRGIALALNADLARDVFLGLRATEKAVKTTDLSRYRVIAFATHGLVPGDLDGLMQPALALTPPEVGDTDGDGLLTMEEILALRLNADWVVLSACNTASGQGAGAEAISGLGRAFFYAGARALLVSNWPVETISARALTTDLFQKQAADAKLTRAKALHQTLNALIDSGEFADPYTKKAVFSYAHPIFWAPFTLVGDGG